MKSFWPRCGTFLAFALLITNTIMCCMLLINNASAAQDQVEPLTTNQACGQCLDLAYEGEDADFTFMYCKENLKRFEITRENGVTEFTYSSSIPPITRNETLESVRTYDNLDSTAFQRDYADDWLDTKREVDYNESAVIFVCIFAICSFCCLCGTGMYLGWMETNDSGEEWICGWGGSSALLMFANIFVWMTTIIVTTGVEVTQIKKFGETECLVIPNGYPFYRTLLVFSAMLFIASMWVFAFNFCTSTKTIASTDSAESNLFMIGCHVLSLLVIAVIWVIMTIMGLIVLDTVDFDTVYENWLICLGVSCAVVCCFVCVCIPVAMKVQSSEEDVEDPAPTDTSNAIKI